MPSYGLNTQSFWEKTTAYNRQWDVIVAGAGVLGLWSALELKKLQPALRILVSEAGNPSRGASTRNAGFVCFGSAGELWHDAQSIGREEMLAVVEMRHAGVQKIVSSFNANEIDYEACGGTECFSTRPAALAEMVATLNEWLQPITSMGKTFTVKSGNDQGLKGFEATVFNPLEGCLHSGKYVKALKQKCLQQQIAIKHGCGVRSWRHDGNELKVTTDDGEHGCSKLLLATNAWLSQLAPDLNVIPARGQVLVTRPLSFEVPVSTFHFDEGFYYWRHLPGNRILLGGARNADFEGETSLEDANTMVVQRQLLAFLQTHLLPDDCIAKDVVDYWWSGPMARTPDKKPLCKTIDKAVVAACCCNGMGVAISPIFAATVAKHLLHA